MDTERISVETPKQIKRGRRSVEEKRRMVEETSESGASVARVALRHAVNANQVSYCAGSIAKDDLAKTTASSCQ
jgi:transposase-like protein